MDILRFIAAGNVDDGKSTLIGRLLFDSKSILIDQLEALKISNKNNGSGSVDLALLTDGLRAEREQGITIDVAYKYFSTPKRKFIIADAPGHFQYTRNMVTGASNSNLSVILVDVRKGVNEQTKRHSIISSLLGISNLVICVNKMDLVNYSEKVFNDIVNDYKNFAASLNVKEIEFIPISALFGDNVVEKSEHLKWYNGKSLLHYLEDVQVEADHNLEYSRFPVQWVIHSRNTENDYRGFAGKIISGIFKKGDKVINFPSGFSTTIKSIENSGIEIEEAFAPMSVTMRLSDELDISRGDVIVKDENLPHVSKEFESYVCWMDSKPAVKGNKYLLQHNSRQVKCIVKEVIHKVDVNTFKELENVDAVNLNDICKLKIRTSDQLIFDTYKKNKANGNFILIDESTNLTAGAGMISSEI